MNLFGSRFLLLAFLSSVPGITSAGTLPGFHVETVVRGPGFVSSLVTDSRGTIYFTTTNGWIYRVDGVPGFSARSTPIASLPTHAAGNGGLLGMALLDDETAVVHYTTFDVASESPDVVLDDSISRVDLASGARTLLHAFDCDIDVRERGASSEHHGGNLTVTPDGAIFVGIGEYGGQIIAQKPEWNGGKIWRLDLAGNATQWARGLRNPFDLAWDPQLQQIVVSDNGPSKGDELHVIDSGANCGWPHTFGDQPQREGMETPAYVFPDTVAPTGLARLDGANATLRHGYLLGTFVARSLFYFPYLAGSMTPAPVAIVENFDEFVLDVTQAVNGDIFFATAGSGGSAIHRLHVPPPGDCNGDGLVTSQDVRPLLLELEDDAGGRTVLAQEGFHQGSWGCDANTDGRIDSDDLHALVAKIPARRRAVRF